MPSTYDVNAPERARMLNLARGLGWPRASLAPRRTSNPSKVFDAVGPGVTSWYLLAEQMPDPVVSDAIRNLLSPPAPATTPAVTLPAEEPLFEVEVASP